METATTHISRRCRPFRASAVLVLAAVAAVAATSIRSADAESGAAAAYSRSDLVNPTDTRSIRITYRSHTGAIRGAIVLVPRWYGANRHPRIPLVIAPHGRGVAYAVNARRWGNLPGIGGFAVVNPAGQGDHLQKYSWGARGQIDDLARMPEIVASKIPWLRIDPARVYAFGGSMGGQETLLLAAQHPRLLAGAAAIDSLVDFPRQYRNFPRLGCTPACRKMWNGPIGVGLQRLARQELGGSPRTASAEYLARSPLSYARSMAKSCLPLQIWWSRVDRVVVDSSKQSGSLFERIRTANSRAPITGYIGYWEHTRAFNPGSLLPLALAKFGLMPPQFDRQPSAVKVIDAPTDACGR